MKDEPEVDSPEPRLGAAMGAGALPALAALVSAIALGMLLAGAAEQVAGLSGLEPGVRGELAASLGRASWAGMLGFMLVGLLSLATLLAVLLPLLRRTGAELRRLEERNRGLLERIDEDRRALVRVEKRAAGALDRDTQSLTKRVRLEQRVEDLAARLEISKDQLLVREQRLVGLLDGLREGIVVLAKDGSVLRSNLAAHRMFHEAGDPTAEGFRDWLMKSLFEESAPDASGDSDSPLVSAFLGQTIRGREIVVAGAQAGEHRTLEYSVAPLRNRKEEIVAAVIVVRDITEKRESERERARLLQILEQTSDLVAVADKDGSLKYLNPAGRRMLGLGADEEPSAVEFGAGDDDMSALMQSARSGHTVQDEARLSLADGSSLILSVVGGIHGADQDDEVFLIARDITKRVAVEQALRVEEARYRSMFDGATDLIQSVDEAGRFRYVNRAWCRAFGYNPVELGRLTVFDLVHPDSLTQSRKAFARISGGKVIDTIELRFVRKDGTPLFLNGNLSSFQAQGEAMVCQGIFRDITSQRETERLKSEFVSIVSHELRTPLTSIGGSLKLLLSGTLGELPKPQAQLLDIAARNSDRLVGLINDLLDIEKLELGEMSFDMQTVDLVEVLKQASDANQGYASKFEVRLKAHCQLRRAFVMGDDKRLIQVLTNLISNACKYSPPGGEVTVSLMRLEGRYMLAVRDNGPGIPEEFQKRIFGRFAQADASDTRRRQGTGLGLAISQAIVEKHGGEIGFRTRAGAGTIFWVRIEARVGSDLQTRRLSPSRNFGQTKVLYVEDDAELRRVIAGHLVGVARLRRAGTLEAARQILAKEKIDAIILDRKLPDGDGLELIREHLEKFSTRPPVIVFSSAGRRDEDEGLVDVWLTKSRHSVDELVAELATLLEANTEIFHG